jgi:hypothetical protein
MWPRSMWALQIPWQIRPVIWPSRTSPLVSDATSGRSTSADLVPAAVVVLLARALRTSGPPEVCGGERDGSISPRGGGRRRRSPVLFRPRQRGGGSGRGTARAWGSSAPPSAPTATYSPSSSRTNVRARLPLAL